MNLDNAFDEKNLTLEKLKDIANNIKEEERMDFTDINNYDLNDDNVDEDDPIDVINKKYNPYTIIITIVTQYILNSDKMYKERF